MAAKTASLSVNIIGDAAKFRAQIKQAEDAANGFSNNVKAAGKAIASVFAGQQILSFAKSTINAASDLGESMNAVRVVFGKTGDQILKFGETASKAVGMSQTQFNAFAVQFAGFTQKLETSTKSAADVTEELTTRIADFASVMNLDIAEAAQVFQSSLAGQTEPIRRFGIDMSAAAVEAFALANGLIKSKDEMTGAIKIQATYGLLMKETNKTAGDFANTSDSLANRQRILAADFENTKAKIGQALLPAMENLANMAGQVLNGFQALPSSIQQTIVNFTLALGATQALKKGLESLGMATAATDTAIKGLRFALLGLTLAKGAMDFLNEATDAAGNAERKLQALAIAIDAVQGGSRRAIDPLQQFRDLVAAEGKPLNLANIIKDVGKEIKIVGGSVGRDIEYIDQAFDKLLSKSPEMARRLLNIWTSQTKQLDRTSQQYQDNMMLIDRYRERLDLFTGSENALKGVSDELESNGRILRSVSSDADELDTSWRRVVNTLGDGRFISRQTMDVWREGYGVLIDAGRATDELELAWRDGYGSLVDAGRVSEEVVDAWKTGYPALARGKEESDFLINAWRTGYRELQSAEKVSYELVQAWKEGYKAFIEASEASGELKQALDDQKWSVDEAKLAWDLYRGALDFRIEMSQIRDDIDQFRLKWEEATKKGKFNAEEYGRDLDRLRSRVAAVGGQVLDTASEAAQNVIKVLVDSGQLEKALILLDRLKAGTLGINKTPTGTYYTTPYGSFPMNLTQLPARANGGLITRPEISLVGEAGPEAIIPLSRPGRALQLMQESGLDMLAMGGRRGGGTTVINISVDAGLVSSPDQVGQQIIEAIRRAERRSGQVFAGV